MVKFKLPSKPLSILLRVAAILAVVWVAGALRLRAVEKLPIDYDEDDYLRAAQQYASALQQRDWAALTELNYRPEHPPLAKLAYGVAISGLPEAPEISDQPTTAQPVRSLPQPHLRTARLAAAVFGLLETLLLALLSPLAGLFLAVHTFTIKYTSQVMLEALPAFSSALAVLAYERSRVYERPRWSGWLALSAVALGLTVSSKYVYGIVGVAILIHWARAALTGTARHRAALLRWLRFVLIWGLLAVVAFLASNPYLWPAPWERRWASLTFHGRYARGQDVQRAGFPLWQPFVWLMGSVPWHPGVFVVSMDLIITGFAALGLRRLGRKRPLYVIWIATALLFLLVWPTKWPQYVLVLTFPWALAAAEGFRAVVWEPLTGWLRRLRTAGFRRPARVRPRIGWRELRKAALWLLPGLLVIAAITYYPLLYQSGMALTDFNARSIRDGLNGGVWRAVRAGWFGGAEPVGVQLFRPSPAKEVRYAGFSLLGQIFTVSPDLLAFELLWTLLVVGLQLALGVSVAGLLHRQGVRFKGFWQALFILPWAIPEFVGALSWLQIVHPDNGWLALAGGRFATTPGYPLARTIASWQQDPLLALLVLLVTGIWMGWPLMMLAASAGLKLIPAEVYDAAAMDGANNWQRLRWVTWPMLLPLLAPVIILRAILAFNQFYLFYVLDPPPPLFTLAAGSFYIFDSGWYAGSAAINMFTVLILIIFILLFNRWSRAGEGVTYA